METHLHKGRHTRKNSDKIDIESVVMSPRVREQRKYELEGKREGLRKGPWKADEDEVLINHVKKCGPKDWSSIRSKGLLQRTGKSCRLRWVNKLRPNLKHGCKFSAEEERVVIELQAQFGNKWAKIATHLPGRTDNDVKNFWSSRQKRLARILQTSTSAAVTPSKSHKNRREIPVYYDEVPIVEEPEHRESPKHFFFKEIPKFSCSSERESSSKAASCSSPCIGNFDALQMVPVPELLDSKLLDFEGNPVQQELELVLPEKNLWIDQSQPLIPFLGNPQLQTELEYSSDTHELLKLDFDMFTTLDAELGKQLDIVPPFLEPVASCRIVEGEKIDNPITPDCVFDDFPVDMFDQIEPLPNDPKSSHV